MTSKDTEIIAAALERFAADAGHVDLPFGDALIAEVVELVEAAIVVDAETRIHFEGGGPPGTMGMMVVRHQRRTSKSIRLKNLNTDTSVMLNAALSAMTGLPAFTSAASGPVVSGSLLSMGVGLAFTVWRAFEKPVPWEYACLLHALNREADYRGVVGDEVIGQLGEVLVTIYGYKKGLNANEVPEIIERLASWRAIERVPGGVKVLESVRFWRGPWLSDSPER